VRILSINVGRPSEIRATAPVTTSLFKSPVAGGRSPGEEIPTLANQSSTWVSSAAGNDSVPTAGDQPCNVRLFEISGPGERDLHVTGGQMVRVNFCRIEMTATV